MVEISEVMEEDNNIAPTHEQDEDMTVEDHSQIRTSVIDAQSQERLLDADEIESTLLNGHIQRPTARLHLQNLITKLRKEGEALRRVAISSSTTTTTTTNGGGGGTATTTTTNGQPTLEDVKAAGMGLYEPPIPIPKRTPAPSTMVTSTTVKYKNFPTHLFDSGKYNSPIVTVYVPLEGIGKHDKTKVSCVFTSTSFDLIVHDFMGSTYRLLNDNLEKEINPSQSKYVIKPNKIIIKLGKTKTGSGSYSSFDSWTQLSSKKVKGSNSTKKEKDDNNPMGGIMDMMKDMYDSGDDNIRKVIGETMYKQRMGQKPDDPFKNDLMGGMGGMDDDF